MLKKKLRNPSGNINKLLYSVKMIKLKAEALKAVDGVTCARLLMSAAKNHDHTTAKNGTKKAKFSPMACLKLIFSWLTKLSRNGTKISGNNSALKFSEKTQPANNPLITM